MPGRKLNHGRSAEDSQIDHVLPALPDLVLRTDSAGMVIDCHAANQSPTPDQTQSFLGRSLADVLPKEFAETVATALAGLRDTRDAADVQCVTWQAGKSRLLELRLMPLGNTEIVAMVRTIARRKQSRRTQSRVDGTIAGARRGDLEVIIESIADAAFVCDETGQIALVNKAGLALIGEHREQESRTLASHLKALQLQYPDGRPVSVDDISIARALRGEVVHGIEELGINPRSHDRVHLLISAAPLRSDDGHIAGAIEIATDITPLRELADLAQRKAAELEAIIDNMVDGVFVSDAAGHFIMVNKAGLILTGFDNTQELNTNLAQIAKKIGMRHADGRPFAPRDLALNLALRGQVVADQEQIIRNHRTGQDIHLQVGASPILDSRGSVVGAVAVGKDMTKSMALDRLKDQFISVAAHELKTPVAIMKGYAQTLLRNSTDPSSPRHRMLEAINRGCDRIDNIVMDLLDVSRLEGGRLELTTCQIDLPALVGEVVNRFALTTPEHRLRLLEAKPVTVEGDRDRLEQVLVNLLDNAVKYSPKGSDVDVMVQTRQGEAVVAVRDAGAGIPATKQADIFERFFRAHTGTPFDYGGMGVGLHICREIVRRHGGEMYFESEEGRGSTFYFSLPLRG